MIRYFISSLKLTLLCLLLFAGIYPLLVYGFAHLVPGKGAGEKLEANGSYYYTNIGQAFTQDRYFWSRPSAVSYNAVGSGGSNKAPFNPEYLQTVQERIDTFLVHNPGIKKSEIPVDLITASGSGLDPHCSVTAAKIQVKRIAKVRNISEQALLELINTCTEKPLLGFAGPEKINLLKLNLALDELTIVYHKSYNNN